MDITILIVDDSPTDAAILVAALDDIGYQWPVQIIHTGDEALAWLQRIDNNTHSYPQLILLDLNLPGRTGYDVLQEIKTNVVWKTIPTIVMSSSATPSDIDKSYRLHANAYITKPTEFREYQLIAQKIQDFWLKTAQLPTFATVCN